VSDKAIDYQREYQRGYEEGVRAATLEQKQPVFVVDRGRGPVELLVVQCPVCQCPRFADYDCSTCERTELERQLVELRAACEPFADAASRILPNWNGESYWDYPDELHIPAPELGWPGVPKIGAWRRLAALVTSQPPASIPPIGYVDGRGSSTWDVEQLPTEEKSK
jgi:hypothetical protein